MLAHDTPSGKLPKISIITPSFNQGRFLERCIRSTLDQDYPALEFFVLDGGSSDNSLEIIQKYAQSFDYWVSEKDRGQSDAINKGFKRATGELVSWLNSDDYLLPGALFSVARAYHQDPSCSFYFGNGLRVDEGGKTKARFYVSDRIYFNREALQYGLNYILQPATFINKKVLEKAGLLDENLHYCMDTDLWLRLSAYSNPMAVADLLAASREYGTTKSLSGSFKRIEELRQLAEKYTGMQMTPGVLCYFLDSLNNFIQGNEDHFPRTFQHDLLKFWESTANLLSQYGAGPDGTPIIERDSRQVASQIEIMSEKPKRSKVATLLRKLANRLES
jgi:glycosyltransferase involved in cell wall biosynthesis